LVQVTLQKLDQEQLTFSLFSRKPSHSKPILFALVNSDYSNNIIQAKNKLKIY